MRGDAGIGAGGARVAREAGGTTARALPLAAILLLGLPSLLPAAQEAPTEAQEAAAGVPERDGAGLAAARAADEEKRLRARLAGDAAPEVDGRLEDAAWEAAEVASGFTQLRPDPGEPATLRTEARLLYTDEAVYVAARMWDPAPDSIIARLSRRDDPSGSDRFSVGIDSYRDRRTAFMFMVNAAGVQMDVRISDDTREDMTWDAVWESAVHRDSAGWSAEIRIPLSQLRYTVSREDGGGQWGLNFRRSVARLGEESYWSPPPADGSALVSAFGTLTGLGSLESVGRLEVRPYTLFQVDRAPVAAGDPFADRTGTSGSVGGSVAYGLTPNVTLNATVNPDFGQVEADPAVVNLSAFETFFPEKRPFFQEGADIFEFGIGLGDSDQEALFYSRRIGRRPRGGAPGGAEFSDVPEATTILGAAKLSGKTPDGWSLGILDAVTAREEGRYQLSAGGETGEVTVEPATNYAVGRVIRDFRDGRSAVGAIATATNRSVADGDRMDVLPSAAYTGGLDFRHRFGGGDEYEVRGYVLGSHVRGPDAAMDRIQTSSTHYFQRPDADHVELVPGRSSLGGGAASVEVRKLGGGNWRWAGFLNARSPGFEVNALGFQRRADEAVGAFWAGFNRYEPEWIFRRWNVGANVYSGWTFGGEPIARGGNVNGSFQLRNFWSGYFGVARSLSTLSVTALRGGPAIREPGSVNGWFGFSSDGRAALRVGLSGNYRFEDETAGRSLSLGPRVTVQPSARMTLSLSPRLAWNREPWQYVTTAAGQEPRYVFGSLDQRTASLTARLDYTVGPDLSLQVYAQPFLSAGSYGSFMEVADPLAASFGDRFLQYGEERISRDDGTGSYRVDRDRDGDDDFSFADPDFNVRQFRSNAVLRWQYRPGSTIFLVWSQDRADSGPDGAFRLGDDARALFDTRPRNVLLVKVEHWLGL